MIPEYRLVDSNGWQTRYVKDHPLFGIRTWLIFDHQTQQVIVRKTQRADAIVEMNKAQQNDTKSSGPMRQVSRIPTVEYWDIMQRCGFKNGEYDESKFRQILDDPDNRYLKTTTAKLGRVQRMI